MRQWGKFGAVAEATGIEVLVSEVDAHARRVATLAVALAGRLGFDGTALEAIRTGALLHDIGKAGIPKAILEKPGPLSDEEWLVMKQHPEISHAYLTWCGRAPKVTLEIARHSHERIDGEGYPDGLAGEEIPLPARIVLVADAFDALTSDRAYRLAVTAAEALAEIRRHAGTQFCPLVVATLEQLFADEPYVLAFPRRLRLVES